MQFNIFVILRSPRSGRLEGRSIVLQRSQTCRNNKCVRLKPRGRRQPQSLLQLDWSIPSNRLFPALQEEGSTTEDTERRFAAYTEGAHAVRAVNPRR